MTVDFRQPANLSGHEIAKAARRALAAGKVLHIVSSLTDISSVLVEVQYGRLVAESRAGRSRGETKK